MLLNNQWITEGINEEMKKCVETNRNKSTMIQNLCDAAKALLRGKFITMQSYHRKQEKSQINNLTLYLKQLEKEKEIKKKMDCLFALLDIKDMLVAISFCH